jgi:predicted metal-dependent phosphoesterase TrpH
MVYGRPGLLCELHAHTTMSDGELTLRELVDLYGRHRFDVLCVTDHCVRSSDPWLGGRPEHVHAGSYETYLSAIRLEALRARSLYDLLLVPGLELTYYDADPRHAAHAVAVGLRSFVGVDCGLEPALAAAREAGAALIAAHPYPLAEAERSSRGTARFAEDRCVLAPAVDRFELFNRHDCFGWVAAERLPFVATGDFHHHEHLATWKTLVPCEKDERALVDYLRSPAPVHVTRFEPERAAPALAA